MRNISKTGLVVFLILALSGCTFIFQTGRRSDARKIEELSRQLDELTRARRLLEDALSKEIEDKQVKLEMMEKGLVITVVGDVLFDSGKAKLREQSLPILDKVSKVLEKNVPQLNVGIEGHTDNQPIKFSGWASNWELSTARALGVLHYIVEEKGISPERVSAIGYGEYRPVATNDTQEGRQLNRRVEIVILPLLTKGQKSQPQAETGLMEPRENLK
ncbi:MAG: OmpA family protein [Candidatus Omnitrophica bacterium]|nr:OmpA family protein [Candidatus Omnitrophota bacterium]MDD5553601.1 OmpA family protein [Candidatus Omnitrophota bacterium]